MRVLVLSPFLPYPLDNGGAIRVHYILREIARRHDVTLLCYGEMDSEAAFVLQFCRAVHTVPTPVFPRPWWQHLRALPGAIPASVCLPAETMRARLNDLMQTHQFDIVQIEFLGLAHLMPDPNGQRNVLVQHCITSQLRRRQLRLMPWSLRRLYYAVDLQKLSRFERRILPAFDACVTVSSTDEHMIRSWAPTLPIMTIPNGIDTEYFSPQCTEDSHSLLFVGSFHLDPANADGIVHFARHAFPRIRLQIPNVTLTIVGSGPPPEVRQLASQPGVSVFGHVHDVRPHFAKAAVVILPLRAGAGTKVRIFTAMAMGKPMLVSPIAAEGIDARPDEEIVLAELDEPFAERSVALLRDPLGRARIGRSARAAAVERYDWRVIGRRLDEFYHSLLAAKAR